MASDMGPLPSQKAQIEQACFSQVPDLSAMTALSRLELSYNQIRSTLPLASCKALSLQELYVSNNKLTSLEVNRMRLCCACVNVDVNELRVQCKCECM